MSRYEISFCKLSTVIVLLLAPGAALGGPIRIATGPNPGVVGYLDIAPDEYGSWAVPFAGGAGPNDDNFNPLGASPLAQVAFTSGFFIFRRFQRELLSDNLDWQGIFPADASLTRLVTVANVATDTDFDGVNDTLRSEFEVCGFELELSFVLTQRVSMIDTGVAFMQQDYTITNDHFLGIDFVLVRTFDGDLVWDGDFSNDEVGTTTNGVGLGPYVFEQEAADPGATAVTLSSLDGRNYYGGKHGVLPPIPGGGVPYDFGTDTEVWDAFGIPTNWVNHIAGVVAGAGYLTNGVSGIAPPGSTPPEDGFMGLDFAIGLDPGESTTIVVFHTYGLRRPVVVCKGAVCPGDVNGDGTVNPLDAGFVLARFGEDPCDRDCTADANCDGVINPLDSGFVLARFGPCDPDEPSVHCVMDCPGKLCEPPGTCDDFTQCGDPPAGSECFCATRVDGTGNCAEFDADGTDCPDLPFCEFDFDCPPDGSKCFVDTCCDRGVCLFNCGERPGAPLDGPPPGELTTPSGG